MEPHCGFCCQNTETTEHVLWERPFARNVWALCRGKIQECFYAVLDFFSRYFGFWSTDLPLMRSRSGPWCLEKFGLRGTNFILIKFSGIQIVLEIMNNRVLDFSICCYGSLVILLSLTFLAAVCICFSLVWGHTAILVLDYSLFTSIKFLSFTSKKKVLFINKY